jgi:hypothetical protein
MGTPSMGGSSGPGPGPNAVASGELIVRWNANAVSLTSDTGVLFQMRELAMVHIAMHDAANIVDLQAAIKRFIAETNRTPKPFVWTADSKRIIDAVQRRKLVIETNHWSWDMRGNLGLFVSSSDRERLAAIVANRNSRQKHVWRAEVVLLTADRHGTNQIMRQTGLSKPSVWRWQERYVESGVDGLLRDKAQPSRIPLLAESKVAEVIRLTLEEAPPTEVLLQTNYSVTRVVALASVVSWETLMLKGRDSTNPSYCFAFVGIWPTD